MKLRRFLLVLEGGFDRLSHQSACAIKLRRFLLALALVAFCWTASLAQWAMFSAPRAGGGADVFIYNRESGKVFRYWNSDNPVYADEGLARIDVQQQPGSRSRRAPVPPKAPGDMPPENIMPMSPAQSGVPPESELQGLGLDPETLKRLREIREQSLQMAE